MSGAEREDEVLRRLVLGELDPAGAEAEAAFARSPELRREWARYAPALASLDDAGREDREVIGEALAGVEPADRERVAEFVATRLGDGAGPTRSAGRPARRWAPALVAAAAALVLLFLRPWAPGPDGGDAGWPAPLAHWSADRGIGDLASSWEPGGALALSWGLATEPRAGTTYRVTVAESSGGRLLEREAGVFGLRWSGAVPVESGRTLLWRVEAIDAEGSVYAAGHAETEPAP